MEMSFTSDLKKYYCEVANCGKAYARPYLLKLHQKKHDAIRDCVCHCGKTFDRPNTLKLHQKTHEHDRGKKVVCTYPDCHAAFYETSDLKRHLKSHSEERNYRCLDKGCNATFKSSANLTRHKLIHTTTKPYECTYDSCHKTFARLDTLQQHVIIHTGERKHACTEADCTLTFASSSGLKRHMLTHSGEKKHICSFDGCGMSFARRDSRRLHEILHTGVNNYICDQIDCGLRFASPSNLRYHVKCHTPEGQLQHKVKEEAMAKELKSAGFFYKREHRIDMSCISNQENNHVRVDFMIVENGCVVIVECNEDQHKGYPVLCDSIRPWKIAETLSIEGNQLPIFMVMFNPDAFRIDGKLQKIPKKDRYASMFAKIRSFTDNVDKAAPLSVAYMYYDLEDGMLSIAKDPEYCQDTLQLII